MIRLTAQQLDIIKSEARSAYPYEACGLLLGRSGADGITVNRVQPARNVAKGRRRDRFEIDPQLRIDLERELRPGPERIVGHYHSHPDAAPLPSETDAERAYEPDLIWLIAAVTADGAGDIRAWRFNSADGTFDEVALAAGGA